MRRTIAAILIALIACPVANASWLSDITGINIDIPNGRVSFGTPNPAAIPRMIENLPKDAATFFLNPAGNALAFAIRQAKGQARADCAPVPSEIQQELSSFFPPQVFVGVCFNLYRPSFTLDSLLLGEMQMGAVTFEDVIVFASPQNAASAELWAHELTHVQQYRALGIEAFAQIYTVGAANLENEAYGFQHFVHDRLAQSTQPAQYWSAASNWSSTQQISNQQYRQFSQTAINPFLCSHKENYFGAVRVVNACPIPIRIMQFLEVNVATGQQFAVACTTPLCVLAPNSYSQWPEDPGFLTTLGQIVW